MNERKDDLIIGLLVIIIILQVYGLFFGRLARPGGPDRPAEPGAARRRLQSGSCL